VREEAAVRRAVEVVLQTEGFAEFFRREYPRLARASLLLTGNVADAEDLTQEALARVYERWAEVGAMDSPGGYLYRTALNLHRKTLRRLAVRARVFVERGERDPLQVAEDRLEVLRAVASLPRAQREALVLVEWLGFDADEAGRLLGIEAVSVRARLHRARGSLRERFGGNDG
jgi:RNA polymerase sigma-70 factor (ECF subfamily)